VAAYVATQPNRPYHVIVFSHLQSQGIGITFKA